MARGGTVVSAVREREIAGAFDDGRESFALDLLEWLDQYPDDEMIEAGIVREYAEELIGWDGDD